MPPAGTTTEYCCTKAPPSGDSGSGTKLSSVKTRSSVPGLMEVSARIENFPDHRMRSLPVGPPVVSSRMKVLSTPSAANAAAGRNTRTTDNAA
ncbi:MAG: hypothetical protein AUG09_07450 [Acidobacteria bacterium 13_1_20CM_2_68_7]|nr:MAG: hypothetical protein AUG09_07450 [Acidobacteria bacterium 13_1_20CM_2_68_7]